ncbi:two-component sensor histidine kinase [Vagococcus martis]|uniref:histidine kinase n=1 Tax=Vagococcus martis TaxID=1768210 RepID=A0A1V4DIH7_9ENTE|nr:sensor histidine kinase KdpD [Vagococcus martis]OPF88283.1 two-component sensor histidine kinase [Vagococcus martis]
MDERQSAQDILEKVKKSEERQNRAKLKVFFGYAAGVGKTYAMLKEAHELQDEGIDVLLGYIEPHARPETKQLVEGLPILSTKSIHYKGIDLQEFDVDEALKRHPDVILVDELAHTNAPGTRNKKRYQDIEELLKAGIDVYTTVNVQHIESLNDIVETLTGVKVQETVPDTFFDNSSLKVIDIEPQELIDRLEHGKIYTEFNAKNALSNFFKPENLSVLRGIAIRRASDHINVMNQQEMVQPTGIHTKMLTLIDDTHLGMTEKCLRWTSRLSTALGSEWLVLEVVEDLSDHDESESAKLAKKLGAEVVVVESDNFLETVVTFTKKYNVTDLVMGKLINRSKLIRLYRAPLEDELMVLLPDVDIHLVPYKSQKYIVNEFNKEKKSKPFEFYWRDCYVTILGLLLATVFSEYGTYLTLGDQNIILVYLLYVMLVVRLTKGYIWAIVSSVLSVLVFNWFFVPPLFSFSVYKEGYIVTLVIMLFVALSISNLMAQIKRQAMYAIKREQQLEILYELNKKYLSVHTKKEIMEVTSHYLSETLDRRVVLYGEEILTPQTLNEEDYIGGIDELAVANWTFINQKKAGYGTDTLMGSKSLYIPVLSNGVTLAVMGIESNKQKVMTDDIVMFLELISTQLVLAIEQNNLVMDKQRIVLENEKERMRGNLLRAISHDLRTPLTGISGSVETVLNDLNSGECHIEMDRKLLRGVQDDADWLIRMVENLLSVTRINEETMKVKKQEEAVEEVASIALQRIKKSYPEATIISHLPEDFLLVPMDAILIEQVLFNLIENAIKHSNSQSPIYFDVTYSDKEVCFSVKDNGIGVTDEQRAYLLNESKKQDTPIDSKNGMGIGLSIVKTIVMAHDGQLYVEKNPEGGVIFSFTLPTGERS